MAGICEERLSQNYTYQLIVHAIALVAINIWINQPVFLFRYQVELDDGGYVFLDPGDENKCNWMMFVRQADSYPVQNLIMYQYHNDIYFISTKTIEPREELRVSYSR